MTPPDPTGTIRPAVAKTLSVVVASGAGGEFLSRCLESLRAQAQRESAEIVVVDRIGGAHAERIRREHPHVRLLDLSGASSGERRASVPELRRRGVLEARGEIVAVLEEHCVAPDGWLAAIRAELGDTDVAIGGPILHSDFRRLRDWVVYFSEYHNYLPPWPPGERTNLNGANIAYSREALRKHEGVLDKGYWEVVLHPLLAHDGRMRAVQAMGAYHTGPFDYGYYLEQRYLLSRVWGGTRRNEVGMGYRLVYLLAAPIFPLLLLLRIFLRVRQSEGLTGKYFACLPLLLIVAVAYVWGEWLGYLLGPGDALERVE